jgi:molybdopterin molybdotransferase
MKKHEHPWISREEALRLILEKSNFQPQTETVPVSEALGRVTSQKVFAQNTLPNSRTSSMDGITVKSAFFNNGIPHTDYWEEGVHYVFSNTGYT